MDGPKTVLDGAISIGGIIILVTLAGTLITILRALKTNRIENEKAQQEREDRFMAMIDKHNDGIEDRLKAVEVKCTDFMPRSEIEKGIDHEKGNRQMAMAGLKESGDRNSRELVELRVEVGKIQERQDSMAGTVGEVRLAVERLGDRVEARFDKLQTSILDAVRKGG